MKTNAGKQGFTLVELLIGTVAAAILVLTVFAILGGPLRALKTNREYAQIRRNMAYAVGMMTKEIRLATFSTIPSDPDLLTLPANSIRTAPCEFYLSGSALKYKINNGMQPDLIIEGVTVFTNGLVENLSTGVKGVTLYLEMQNNDGSIKVTHESFVHARN